MIAQNVTAMASPAWLTDDQAREIRRELRDLYHATTPELAEADPLRYEQQLGRILHLERTVGA